MFKLNRQLTQGHEVSQNAELQYRLYPWKTDTVAFHVGVTLFQQLNFLT